MIDEKQKNSNELLSKYFKADSLSEKTKVLIEKLTRDNNQLWSGLPWHNQFVPIIFKYFTQIPWVKYVNPGMTNYSGLIEIPKSEINKHLVENFLPISVLVTSLPHLKDFQNLLALHSLSFPIICKPNTGERASGVCFIQNTSDLEQFIKSSDNKPFLVQEYLTQAKEFGIVIERKSKTSKEFRVISCVEKKTRNIIGNGTDSVAVLIENLPINDSQKAKIKLAVSEKEKAEVLPKDYVRNIVRTASITLGTVFINREAEVTSKLEVSLSKSLKNYTGFNVGRFDIMAHSLTDIENGDYKIIELNGVGATPLNIYESDKTVAEIYEILENYYELLLSWGKKNAPEKKLKIKDFAVFLRQIYPAIKNQSTTEVVKQATRKNFKIMRHDFWKSEWKKFCMKCGKFFSSKK